MRERRGWRAGDKAEFKFSVHEDEVGFLSDLGGLFEELERYILDLLIDDRTDDCLGWERTDPSLKTVARNVDKTDLLEGICSRRERLALPLSKV